MCYHASLLGPKFRGLRVHYDDLINSIIICMCSISICLLTSGSGKRVSRDTETIKKTKNPGP